MNAENFVKFIKDFSQLYQLPYEELKSLVMQYPYSTNLHYLLLIKSHQEQHKEFEKNLRTSAIYSQDRSFLYGLLKQLNVNKSRIESFELAEDYLELKDLSFHEEELAPLPVDLSLNDDTDNIFSFHTNGSASEEEQSDESDSSVEVASSAGRQRIENLLNSISDIGVNQDQERNLPKKEGIVDNHKEETIEGERDKDKDRIAPKTTEKTDNQQDTPLKDQLQDENTSSDIQPEKGEEEEQRKENHRINGNNFNIQPVKDEEVMETSRQNNAPMPTPKTSFSSWVQQFQPVHIRMQLSELMESKKREDAKMARRQKRHAQKNIQSKVSRIAELSLRESQDLASETLAELLVLQQQYDRAIKMYNQLILKFPEKSSYFAAKIEKLKNL